MEGPTARQFLELGNAPLIVQNSEQAMRNFARGYMLDSLDPRVRTGIQAALSLYNRQVRIMYNAEHSPVYNGVEKIMDASAVVFYNTGMHAFLHGDYAVAKLYFAETIIWDPTNAHILDCFRTSVELWFQNVA